MTLAHVMDAVYRQRRKNEALGLSGDMVDIIATKQYADKFHKMLERNVRAHSAMPKIIKWTETSNSVIGADVRRYTSECIGWPLCDVSVLIPKGYRAIFAVPDYQAERYFCLIRLKEFDFPQRHQMRIVICTGCYDVLHRGHLDLLSRAAALGDRLVVGINSDAAVKRLKGPGRPVNNEADRMAMLRALRVVDQVIVIDAITVTNAILEVKPAVWVKGGDWTLATLNKSEVAAARAVGAEIVILPTTPGYSSTATIERMASR